MFAGFDDALVSYEMTVEPEDLDVRGNVMDSGDADYDRQVEDTILERIDDGDDWAWARVRVTATYEGVDCVVGDDVLGGCSYRDEKDFCAPGGYYEDMLSVAREDLYTQLEGILARFGCIDPAAEPECID
jgi:hypothetical protein